ncbi:MAG TPA: molecular chaperone [Thermoanaerobaculia bacterium]|nr:molecular chaperone [Thermoanaerobaculia bacterium]
MKKTFLIVALALFAAASAAQAGEVTVFPKRVVFGDRMRTAEVTLVNQGDRPLTYRIELIEQRMTPAGTLEAAAPGERSALALLRYSPRQVTVAPGAPQTIRLLLRKPEDLPPGEYRIHLLCRALPAESAGTDVESLGENEGLAVRLVPIPAVSIPVLVRHGEGLRGSVHLSGLAFDPGARALSFRLEREGDVSVYGDLTAVFQPADGGPERVVAKTRGMAVYTEIPAIQTRLALDPGPPLAAGRLLLRFNSRPEDDGGGPAVSAAAEVEIP